jgi:hypothetical protein
LPLKYQVKWETVRDAYNRHIAKIHKGDTVGPTFILRVRTVIKDLGKHWKGNSKHKESAGDSEAFLKFFESMESTLPGAGSFVVV